MYFVPYLLKNKGYLMHNSDAISILNCLLDRLSFVYVGSPEFAFLNIEEFKNMGCEPKHVRFLSCSFWAEA